jgi:hypothetical protein
MCGYIFHSFTIDPNPSTVSDGIAIVLPRSDHFSRLVSRLKVTKLTGVKVDALICLSHPLRRRMIISRLAIQKKNGAKVKVADETSSVGPFDDPRFFCRSDGPPDGPLEKRPTTADVCPR